MNIFASSLPYSIYVSLAIYINSRHVCASWIIMWYVCVCVYCTCCNGGLDRRQASLRSISPIHYSVFIRHSSFAWPRFVYHRIKRILNTLRVKVVRILFVHRGNRLWLRHFSYIMVRLKLIISVCVCVYVCLLTSRDTFGWLLLCVFSIFNIQIYK